MKTGKIEMRDDVCERLKQGKRVRGSMYYDRKTRMFFFNGYRVTCGGDGNLVILKKTPFGSVKLTKSMMKRTTKLPTGMSLPEKLDILDAENSLAKDFMTEIELIERV